MPWCCVSQLEVDDDFGSSLCDSESVCDLESEASWDSEAEVSETDFGLELECLGSEPSKSGIQSKTGNESTTYNKSRCQLAKTDGEVITHAQACVTDYSLRQTETSRRESLF